MNRQQLIVITIMVGMFSVIPFYKFKSRMGVNILPGQHTPVLVEKKTRGLIKARWIDRNYIRRPRFNLINLTR